MRPPRFRADRAPWYLRCWPLARSGDRRGGLVLRRGGAARRLHSRGAGHSPCPDCAAPMTFAFTLLSLSASGLAVLHLARLQTGRFTVDLPLAWFVGSGWFALGAMTLRFVGSVPYSRGGHGHIAGAGAPLDRHQGSSVESWRGAGSALRDLGGEVAAATSRALRADGRLRRLHGR